MRLMGGRRCGRALCGIGFGIEAVEFGGADQAVDCGGAFATGIGARE